MTTPNGQWIGPKPTPHRCILPDVESSAYGLPALGARWRCECGKTWELYMESQHGESWRALRRVKDSIPEVIPHGDGPGATLSY